MGKIYQAEEKKFKEHGDSHSQETADTQQRKEEAVVQKEHSRNYAEIVKPPKTQTSAVDKKEEYTHQYLLFHKE